MEGAAIAAFPVGMRRPPDRRSRSRPLLLLALTLALLGPFALMAGTPGSAPASAAAPAHERHVVRAGWTNPGDSAEPFIYTAYYPQDLQVHRGDTVEWRFPLGYGGWHSVSFVDGPRPPMWRTDEAPGVIGFGDAWANGHEGVEDDVKCGRQDYLSTPDQAPCRFTPDLIDEVGEQFSSAVVDRFVSTADDGAFVAEVDLPEGTYPYFCKLHAGMEGTLRVVAPGRPLANPTDQELERQRDADHANAVARSAELERQAWDPETRQWTVLVGASTTDGRVGIYDYLPAVVKARRGDRVRFVAGTAEPNSVTFADTALQGGFNLQGECRATSCSPGTGAPHGMVGFAYPWACDYDGTSSGLPGVPLAWVPPRVADDAAKGNIDRGCPEADGVPGAFEMGAGPTMSAPQPAPGNLVVDETTFHNSGIVFDASLPDWTRRKPDGSHFPSTFDAVFPAAGTFPYFCLAHEFMKGQIDVV